MGDSVHNSSSSKSPEIRTVIPGTKVSQKSLVASRPKIFSKNRNGYGHLASLGHGRMGSIPIGNIALFLLKVAALETMRRFSRAKCPFAWRAIQALQLICYPPLKWIQRWAPFRVLAKGMQTLSRPLLVLSIATAFSDQEDSSSENSNFSSNAQAYSNPHSDSVAPEPASDAKCMICNEAPRIHNAENWQFLLRKELENQGITLPDRMDEAELCRFYAAVNCDFSRLLSSVKKTIRWRETYRILKEEELQIWSNLLFWHGYDLSNRPCLIVRLGQACVNLPYHERPCFAQAVISQVEHGVLHLVNGDNGQVTVLVDCEGLSPCRVPMQMMRSCFSLLQEHYPNRLGCLFVIRLPPLVRVIAQTLIQVLRPTTRQKLRIVGELYKKVLDEYLQTLPLYLGGNCSCTKCRMMSDHVMHQLNETNRSSSVSDSSEGEETEVQPHNFYYERHMDRSVNWEVVVTGATFVILMFLALITLLADPENRLFLSL